MPERLSLSQLAHRANAWCREHGVAPASDQAAEAISERNIRFYRTLGLLDPPAGGPSGYREKHLLQLTAIRVLQAHGTPLRKIRELLYGRAEDDLREISRRGALETAAPAPLFHPPPAAPGELWRMIPLTHDFLLISRNGAPLTPAQREALLQALQPSPPQPDSPQPIPHETL
jgi:DNA-binding transcriptional MerR regulator